MKLHNTQDEQRRIEQLLRQSLPPVEDAELARDLWPAVLRRLDRKQSPPLFDWALLAGLIGLAVVFPSAIPVLLYYL